MRENTDPPSNEALRAYVGKNSMTVAQREMDYTLWRFGDDTHDISDGPFPVGDRVAEVHGLGTAIEQCRLLMRQDVTIRFMHVVPKRPSTWCDTKVVRRRIIQGASREVLDPTEGLSDFARD